MPWGVLWDFVSSDRITALFEFNRDGRGGDLLRCLIERETQQQYCVKTYCQQRGEIESIPRQSCIHRWQGLTEEGVHEVSGYVQIKLRIQFSNAGRTGDVDLGQVIANDINADKVQPTFYQLWPYLLCDPSITVGERTAFAAPASG
jgi:hypothetical protein